MHKQILTVVNIHIHTTQMGEMEMTQITNVITLAQYADKYGYDVKRLRRLARKNEWPAVDHVPFKFGDTNGRGGVWAIDANADPIELPAKSERGQRRGDGRQRYIVYANDTTKNGELQQIINIVGVDNVVNPRVAAKLRRIKRAVDAENAVENVRAQQIIGDAHKLANAVDATENDDNG